MIHAPAKQALIRTLIALAVTGVAAAVVLIMSFAIEVRTHYSDRITMPEEARDAVYGVVLGASIEKKTGLPATALRDRLDTAIDLLKRKKIMGIAVTGDDGAWKSDEVGTMVNYLHSAGVPDEVILVDAGSYRTFDSCVHLKNRGLSQVVLITQRFHLPRALYLCNKIGVDAHGVIADRRWYTKSMYYWLRDFLASPFAYLDVRGITVIEKGPTV